MKKGGQKKEKWSQNKKENISWKKNVIGKNIA